MVALGLTAANVPQKSTDSLAEILGDWTGESLCVGNLPSCRDEKVIYHFSKSAAGAAKLKMAADKIVDGKPEAMGDLEFQYDAAKGTLTGEFQNARYHGRWEFTVKGKTMIGTLVLLPDKTVVRRASVKKVDSPQKEFSPTP